MDPMPTPRPRARVIAPKGRRPIVSMYSPAEYKAWQAKFLALLAQMDAPSALLEGPLEVSVACYVARPKTTKLSHPKPDVDNYAKGVLDCITQDGRFWTDDTQVRTLHVTKSWTAEGEVPAITVTIKEL